MYNNGELLHYNFSFKDEYLAFTRELNYGVQYYYRGHSRNISFLKSIRLYYKISINTRAIIFEPKTKFLIFLQYQPELAEIHSIHTV